MVAVFSTQDYLQMLKEMQSTYVRGVIKSCRRETSHRHSKEKVLSCLALYFETDRRTDGRTREGPKVAANTSTDWFPLGKGDCDGYKVVRAGYFFCDELE